MFFFCILKTFFSECYPIVPTVLAQSPQGPIRGLNKPSPLDSDEDNDPVMPPTKHSAVPTPQVATGPPVYNQPTITEPVHDVIPVQELPPVPAAIVPAPYTPASPPVPSAAPPPPPPKSAVVIPPRRSGHQHRAPFWHNPDWDLE